MALPRAWLCAVRPIRAQAGEIVGYRHHLVMINVVGAGRSLPFDVEPYGPGEGELSAAKRLLRVRSTAGTPLRPLTS